MTTCELVPPKTPRFCRFLFLQLLFLLLVITLDAQDLIKQDFVPKSPNAAAAEKFQDIPVDYSSGIPSISIPLYTIKSKTLSIPVVLRFHAGGIKTTEMASWVGLGWDLQCGGVITRELKGNPDEGISYYSNKICKWTNSSGQILYLPDGQFPTAVGYHNAGPDFKDPIAKSLADYSRTGGYLLDSYHPYSFLTDIQNLVQDLNNYNTNSQGKYLSDYLPQYASGVIDLESDVFQVSTPEFSTQFQLNTQRQFSFFPNESKYRLVAQPYQEVVPETKTYQLPPPRGTVIVKDTLVRRGFRNWIINADNGVSYHFGTDTNSYSIKYDNNSGFKNQVTEWYLNKIIDPNNNDSILIENQRLHPIGVDPSSRQGSLLNRYSDAFFARCMATNISKNYTIPPRFGEGTMSAPKKITTGDEIITFHATYNMLDSIVIKNLAGQLKRRIEFKYNDSKISGRTVLTGIKIIGTSAAGYTPSYLFDYYDSIIQPLAIDTAKFAKGTQVSSYVQGNKAYIYYTPAAHDYWGYNNGRFMEDSICMDQGNRNFKPKWPFAQQENLKKIHFPSGVVSTFIYEPHNAADHTDYNGFWDTQLNPLSFDTIGGCRIKTIINRDTITGKILTREYRYQLNGGVSSGLLNITPSRYTIPTSTTCLNSNIPVVINFRNRKESEVKLPHVQYREVKESITSGDSTLGYTIYKYFTDIDAIDTFYSTYSTDPLMAPYTNVGNTPEYLPKWEYKNLLNGKLKTKEIYDRANDLLQRESCQYEVRQGTDRFQFLKQNTENVTGYCSYQYVLNPAEPRYNGVYINTKHYVNNYHWYNKVVNLKKTISEEFRGGDTIISTELVKYESPYHNYPTSVTKVNSNGDTIISKSLYAFDYTVATDSSFYYLKKNYYNPLISNFTLKGDKLLSSEINTFKIHKIKPDSARTLPEKLFVFESVSPKQETSLVNITYPVTSVFPNNLYVQKRKMIYDTFSVTLRKQTVLENIDQAYQWDATGKYPLLAVSHADSTDIAFTSFEPKTPGGWTYNTSVTSPTFYAGEKGYNLTSGAIQKIGLNTTRKYRLSYWISGSSPLSITGTVGTAQQIFTKGSWTKFIHEITGISSLIVSGSAIIDELLLCPALSEPSTFTYDGLGQLVAQSNKSGETNLFEYNGLGQLLVSRNQQGEILQKNDYKFWGNTLPVRTWSNFEARREIYRINCTEGYTGGKVLYTIPAGTYTSTINPAHVLMQVENDFNQNAQSYANINGACNLAYLNKEKYQNFTKSCPGGQINTYATYLVPEKKYLSDISQGKADSAALFEINSYGQTSTAANQFCVLPAQRNLITLKNDFYDPSTELFLDLYINNVFILREKFPPLGQNKTYSVKSGLYQFRIYYKTLPGGEELLLKLNGVDYDGIQDLQLINISGGSFTEFYLNYVN